MDEAGDFSHTPTQELRKVKAKYKCRSYWWWSPKPYLSIQPGEAAVSRDVKCSQGFSQELSPGLSDCSLSPADGGLG